MIGKTLAHYKVTAQIGAGGMGEVYRARDTTLDRDVALKVLPDAFANDTEKLERFAREAKLLASLNHTNIAAIHGFEHAETHHFLVLELVEGEDLSMRVARGPLPVEEVVDVGLQVARALEEAHERGIVHRDLKPANIKLSPDGTVKVLDFGLAKALASETNLGTADMSQSPTVMSSGTIHGVIMGTAAYMSPEQARGKPVDKRADIWAYGVILYELLTGSRLFGGETVSDIIAGVLKTSIDIDELPRTTPPALRRVITRCLDRDPRTRLRDIGEARVLLEQPLPDEPGAVTVSSGPGTAPGRRPTLLAVGVAVGAVVGFFVARATTRDTVTAPPQMARLEIPVTATDGVIRFALNAAGSKLVFADAGRLFIRDLDQVEEREVPGSEGAIVCEWSPSSEWIAYSTGPKLYKIRPDGTQRFLLCNVEGGMHATAGGMTWQDDGHIVFSTGDTGLWSVSELGGSPVEILAPRDDELDFHSVSSLPGGKGFMFVPHSPERMDSVDLVSNGERTTLVEETGDILGQAVYSDGYVLYDRRVTNPGLWAMPFSLETLRPSGSPFLLEPGRTVFAVSRNGHLAYSHGSVNTRRELVILDRRGNTVRTVIAASTGLDPAFSLSPDGTRVAVTLDDEDRDIWIYEIDGGARQRFVFGPEEQRYPAWSPNGDQIAYVAGAMIDNELWIRSLSQSTTTALSVPRVRYMAFSSDGQTLVLSQNDTAMDPDLTYMQLTDEEPTVFLDTNASETHPALSPDGRYLAYASDASGRSEIYIQEFPQGAGKWQVSQEGGSLPSWSHSGDRLYFRNGRRFMEVEVGTTRALTLGPPSVVFENSSMISAMPTRNPDEFAAVQRIQADSRAPSIIVWMNWTASIGTP